jgi:hypothetical protein
MDAMNANYNDLMFKPKINGHVLRGNLNSYDLNLENTLTAGKHIILSFVLENRKQEIKAKNVENVLQQASPQYDADIKKTEVILKRDEERPHEMPTGVCLQNAYTIKVKETLISVLLVGLLTITLKVYYDGQGICSIGVESMDFEKIETKAKPLRQYKLGKYVNVNNGKLEFLIDKFCKDSLEDAQNKPK